MHKIGDKVIYGAAGVMTVVDIREEAIADVNVARLKEMLAADFSQHENKNPPSFLRDVSLQKLQTVL